MGVLQPWLLLLAAAAAVPLLLHLFQRHHGPQVVFPALRYLRRAEKESARRVRLRQLLLLLLRVGAVLLLTLAAARPFLLGAGSAHQPAAVVIILDNSPSTGAVSGERRSIDELRDRALATLAAAGAEDRFWLLRAAEPDEPALAGDPVTIARLVRETEPALQRADPAAALARARTLLAAGAAGRTPEIQLLSDLQASEWRPVSGRADDPPLVLWTPPGEPPVNHAITAVSVAGGMAPLANTRAQLSAAVAGGDSAEVGIRLLLDERLVAAARARSGSAALLTLPPRPAGPLTGRVEADPDALRADDRRWFAVQVLPPPAVVAPGADEFLAEALAVMAAAGRVRAGAPGSADIAVLSGALGIGAVAPGAAVIVLPPAAAVELPAVNRRLAGAGIDWRYAPPTRAGEVRLAADPGDPLSSTLARVRLSEPYGLVPGSAPSADSVLLRLADGAPWLVRGSRPGGGRFLLLASALTEQATSIPASAAMIPLLDRMLGTWSAPLAPPAERRPGEEVAIGRTGVTVQRPDGARDDVASGSYRVPALPGVYRVQAGDSLLGAFAVNLPPEESDLERASVDRLRALLPGWRTRTAGSEAEWARSVYQARLGLQLWRPLLIALLALLIIESIVAATGARRRRAAPTEEV